MSDNEFSTRDIQLRALETYFLFRSNLPDVDTQDRPYKKAWKTTEDIAEELSSMISIPYEDIASYMLECGYTMGTLTDGTVAWAIWERLPPIE